jgi:integrase
MVRNMPAKIKKRGNDAYLLSVAVGYDEKGKQIVKTKTIKATSDREADRAYNVFAAEVQQGTIEYTGKYKLAEFAEMWFRDYCMKNLAPKTQRSYKNHIENRIIPALGYIDINKLRPQHIMKFIDTLQENGMRLDGKNGKLSGESVRYCFRVLSSMLQDALQWQIINNNPCSRVKPPNVDHQPYELLSEEDIAKMIQALQLEPLKYRMVIMLAIDSGLRLGELMGLKWGDIDVDKATLNVTKSNQALKGKGIFTKDPKNKSSIRRIALSGSLIILLKQYHTWQLEQKFMLANKWVDENWLFTKWNGKPMYPTTPSQWFRKFLKRHALSHMPFHALRHLSATLLIGLGVPLKNVSSRLGHADIRTTANIYGTALQSVDRQAADKMDQYLQQVKKQ